MVQNPNWPLMEYAICFPTGPGALTPVSSEADWLDVTTRTQDSTSVTRGKQYELDQVQPGTMTFTLRNDDGAFDPSNTASPYNGFVLPYRLVRLRAQYPATVNRLNADQATARFSSVGAYTGTTLPNLTTQNGVSPLSIVAGPGSINSYSSSVAAGAPAFQGVKWLGASWAPGVGYSARITASTTTAVAVNASMSISWFNAAGVQISTTFGPSTPLTTTPTTVSIINAVAPANVASATLNFLTGGAPAGAVVIRSNSVQLEKSATSSAYVTPNPWYSIFTGYIERWPQEWLSAGNKGLSQLTCIDLFTFLANRGLDDPFHADVLALNPNFFYALNEANGATQFMDSTGNRPAATITLAAANTVLPGASITSGDNSPQGDPNAISGAFLGTNGPVLNMGTYTPSTTHALNGGMISLPPNPATGFLGVPQNGIWTRFIAARLTEMPPDGAGFMWSYDGNNNLDYGGVLALPLGPGLPTEPGFVLTNTGSSSFTPFSNVPSLGTPPTVTDSDWHLYGLSLGTNLRFMCDATFTDFGTGAPFSWTPRTTAQGAVDSVGAQGTVPRGAANQWVGDLALYCELPFEMTPTVWAAIYNSWRNGWATTGLHSETSDQRYQRILNWIGYVDTPVISPGAEIAYGPATDIVGGRTPTDTLTALQNVVDTELGQHFVNKQGVIVFQSRIDRYNKVGTVTFGENVGSGEIPYTNAKTDFDPTRITNTVDVTSQYGNVVYNAADAASKVNYGIVSTTRTANSMDPNSLAAQAQALIYENAQPDQRLEALPVDVSGRPASWGPLLGLELGDAVTVNRRPVAAPLITIPGFIEQIVWNFNGTSGTAGWTGQVSNSAQHTFFQLDSATLGILDTSRLGY